MSRASWALVLVVLATPLRGQGYPAISNRQFTGGSAKVVVTGSFSINEDVAINQQASIGAGDMTWIQFGASGSAKPNALITYGDNQETGITVALGKMLATGGIMVGEKSECSGKVQVTSTLISGHYVCRGLTSHDPVTSKLGKVDVEVTFTARS
jgi:hypothetical protein